MADFTFTFGPKTKTFTISGANATRFQAWANAVFATIPNPAFPSPGVPKTLPNPEPILSAIDAIWLGLKNNVKNFEQQKTINSVPAPGDLT